jgi:hypothetical protein
MTTDLDSSARFYTRVVGWEKQAWDQDPSYRMFATGGVPMAGYMLLPEDARRMGAPPHWMTYIGTPDVDATAAQAEDLGARVLKSPTDIPNVGRFSVIQDPQGATFSAFTPNQPPPGDGKPSLGDFSWHELTTTDWPAALHFYHRLFGWEKAGSMEMGPDIGTYQMFG